MAEASSSRGERSKEDEQDEVSSHCGPVSSMTAVARPPHGNQTKELHYFQDYLQRIPKHQRLIIQKEIDRGFKPGEASWLLYHSKFGIKLHLHFFASMTFSEHLAVGVVAISIEVCPSGMELSEGEDLWLHQGTSCSQNWNLHQLSWHPDRERCASESVLY